MFWADKHIFWQERYRAVWRPVEYHNKCKGINPWRRVLTSYVLPVVIFSIFFNIPKLFEVKFVVKSISLDDSKYSYILKVPFSAVSEHLFSNILLVLMLLTTRAHLLTFLMWWTEHWLHPPTWDFKITMSFFMLMQPDF